MRSLFSLLRIGNKRETMQAVKLEEFKSKLMGLRSMGLRSKTKAQQIFDLKRRLILSFT